MPRRTQPRARVREEGRARRRDHGVRARARSCGAGLCRGARRPRVRLFRQRREGQAQGAGHGAARHGHEREHLARFTRRRGTSTRRRSCSRTTRTARSTRCSWARTSLSAMDERPPRPARRSPSRCRSSSTRTWTRTRSVTSGTGRSRRPRAAKPAYNHGEPAPGKRGVHHALPVAVSYEQDRQTATL